MIRRIMLSIFLALPFLGIVSAASAAYDPFSGVCTTPEAKTSTVCQTSGKDPITGKDQEGIAIKVAKLIALAAGIAAVIIIIIAGIQYSLSTGDSAKISRAKDTIIYAAIGLAIAIFAQAIIVFVINKL